MTGEEWDTGWYSIYDDARADGCSIATAQAVADRECTEQFDERPQEETKR